MVEYSRTISSNAIDTNFKQNIRITASGTLYNIYPIKAGMKCALNFASGATVAVSGSSGNIKMTSDFTGTQGDTLNLSARDISGTLYWVPLGGKANNA